MHLWWWISSCPAAAAVVTTFVHCCAYNHYFLHLLTGLVGIDGTLNAHHLRMSVLKGPHTSL